MEGEGRRDVGGKERGRKGGRHNNWYSVDMQFMGGSMWCLGPVPR